MLGEQLDELKLIGDLPSPTGVGLRILQLTQGEDYSIGELTKVLQSDPALSGRIIRLANGAPRTGIEAVSTVSEAAMRLGVRSVRNVALGFTLVNGNRSGGCVGFEYEEYWARSLATAVCAQVLAGELRTSLPADAFTCGLLSGIGRLALASIHPERYSVLIVQAKSRSIVDLTPLEKETFDVDHNSLAEAMLRSWNLPESFAFAVANIDRINPIGDAPDDNALKLAKTLRYATRLAQACLLTEHGRDEEELDLLAQELELEPETFARLCQVVADDWTEWGQTLRVPVGDIDPSEVTATAARLRSRETRFESTLNAGDTRGLRILAVDDDPVSLRLLEHHLTRDGHAVTKATNGRQALVAALDGKYQMVVTDWMMPEMDGVELCRALRRNQKGRGLYILLLTGREDENRVVEAFQAGADEYVVKPFNPKLLLARVRAGQRMIELREQVERDRQELQKQHAEMAILNRKAQAAAMTDVLTKLPNRRYAMKRLNQEVATAKRAGGALSVIMIDIDHFKDVNDRFGHDLGDVVLRETAAVLKRETRKSDTVCRLGGEEFLVICPTSDLHSCSATAERIRYAVEENVIGFGFDGAVTVSLGVASLENGAQTVDELLKSSDRRVYSAKAFGRNRVCSDDPPAESKSA